MGISIRAVAVGIPSSRRDSRGGPDTPESISTSKFHFVQHVLDGRQDSTGLPPSMQQESLCRTTQHLESKSRQSNDWQTNRLTPRPGYILLHWVFLRLRIRLEERFLAFSFLVLSRAFVMGIILACSFVELVRAKTHPYGSHHCHMTSPSCLSFLWTTKLGPLLAAIQYLALDHHHRMLFRSF